MGASSSTGGEMSVDEGTTGGAVKVSEAVARRLIGQPDRVEKKTPQTTFVPVSDHAIEDEVQKLKKHYDRRIELLEKQNEDLRRISAEEFSSTVEDVEKKYLKLGPPRPICEELQTKVMECYQDNANKSLLCRDTVSAYKACVEEKRDGVLTKKDEECQPCMLAQMARGPCGLHFMKAYDCYLEDGDREECGLLYLEMKECWDKYPSYGYQQIIDRAYKDTPKERESEDSSSKVSREVSAESEDAKQTEAS